MSICPVKSALLCMALLGAASVWAGPPSNDLCEDAIGPLAVPFVELGPQPIIGASLDIKPGSCPNSFNRNSNHVLPVALVGTDDFDVLDVDLSTLELSRGDGVGGQATPLEGPPGPHSVVEDAATPFDGELCDCHELEGDGIDDLSLKFPDVVAELQLDEFSRGDLVELCVSGTLLDGRDFDTCDCIRIVK